MLFKLFNKIETWETLESALGEITWANYSFDAYDQVLSGIRSRRHSIYSAAYIMPPGDAAFGFRDKHKNNLMLLEKMMLDDVPHQLQESKRMQQAFQLLRSYPTIGDFLAYQFETDLNYSPLTNFKETEFVIPGPGAKDGLRKCFSDPGGLTEPELIRFVCDIQQEEFERLGLDFQTLWGRPLQLIDCQNLFCEVDKYSRVAHPEIAGISGRTRIKQRFTPHQQKLSFWYPPKWKLNNLIIEA